MARQGGWVQLEQSDMRLAMITGKIAQDVFERAAIQEMQFPREKISPWCPRRGDAGCWVSVAWNGERCDRKTPSHASSEPDRRRPSLPQWQRKESADTPQTQSKRWISTWPMQTANSRADATSAQNAHSARNATCTTRWQCRSVSFPTRLFPGRRYVSTFFFALHWISYTWCICPG